MTHNPKDGADPLDSDPVLSPTLHRAIEESLQVALAAGVIRCAKCQRVFKSAAEYRMNAQGKPICRKFCREAAHG